MHTESIDDADVKQWPTAAESFSVLRERHCLAFDAHHHELSEIEKDDVRRLDAIHESDIGRRAFVLLSAQHAKYIAVGGGTAKILKSTLYGFASEMTRPYEEQSEACLAWWRKFSGDVDRLMNVESSSR